MTRGNADRGIVQLNWSSERAHLLGVAHGVDTETLKSWDEGEILTTKDFLVSEGFRLNMSENPDVSKAIKKLTGILNKDW